MSQAIHPFSDKETAILKYEPIELNGLVYYPILVADYDKWQAIKPVLTLRQGTLPAVYACMTFLQCVWALHFDAVERGDTNGDVWNILGCMLFLSLRLSDEDTIQAITDPKQPRTITSIRIHKDGEQHDIGVMDFAIVRKLISDQNGAELPDEADNPDLIEAANDIANANTVPLKCDYADMLTSVATEMRIRRSELLGWSIKEFGDVFRAIRRKHGFIVSSIAESQGAKFTKGNPYPTWVFDRKEDEYAGLIPMDRLQADHHAIIAQEDAPPDYFPYEE